MKKEYIKPEVKVVKLQQQLSLLAGSGGGDGVHTDNPQKPSSAFSRAFDFDDDYDE
jgi:hypothetical protein